MMTINLIDLITGTAPAPIPEGIGRKVLLLRDTGCFYESSREAAAGSFETRPQRVIAAIKKGRNTLRDIAAETGLDVDDARKALQSMAHDGRVVLIRRCGQRNQFFLPEDAPKIEEEQ